MSRHTITLTGEETTQVAHQPAVMDAPKEASLVQIYGPSLGSRYVLDKAEITIGRHASNDIVLDNVNVSRAHARLLCHDGRVVLEDLGSTNRSAVNDQDITNADLRNGDIVKIGSVILKFLTGGNAEALYYGGDSDSRAYIDPEAPPSDPYQLVRSLLALQRQQQTAPAIEGDGYRGSATGSPLPPIEAAATAPEPCFHAGEIAQLLPELQCWGQHLSQDIRNRTVRERLQSELQRRVGGTQPRHMGNRRGTPSRP
jgi:hypothetical protein